jgi:exoribonuclease R
VKREREPRVVFGFHAVLARLRADPQSVLELFVDGLVHISELGRDYFQFDAARHQLFGERTGKRWRLADRMTVKLVRVDLESRKIDFVPAG